ncbi:transcriptional regulator, AraC family protein, partial [Citreicella sp. 357]
PSQKREAGIMFFTELVDLCARDGAVASAPPPAVCIYRRDAPSALEAYAYEPVLCMVLQGAKTMRSGDQSVEIGAGDALIVSQHLPVISRITQASPQRPYLAIVLSLNLVTLRELYAQLDGLRDSERQEGAISCSQSDPSWVEPLHRYLDMSGDLAAMSVLGPQVLREIHFRLLTSSTGASLRNLMATDGSASRISRSIAVMREQLAAPLKVPDIAEQIGMSNSAFHSHFKKVTGTTPLQFQKDLRLITAMELLEHSRRSVASVAYKVGYESPTHFSRDYKRKFGYNPSASRSLGDTYPMSMSALITDTIA